MRRSALALLLGCLLLVAGASALDGYDYYQTIEYAACDQDIYQQDIVIHRSTGTAYNETAGGLETWHIYVGEHCREDYGDIRFTNSTGSELTYYLWPDYSSSSARFAVRLEGATSAGVLAVHYGNPSVETTSDAAKNIYDWYSDSPDDWGSGIPFNSGTGTMDSTGGIHIKTTNTKGMSWPTVSGLNPTGKRIEFLATALSSHGDINSQFRLQIVDNTTPDPGTSNGVYQSRYDSCCYFNINSTRVSTALTFDAATSRRFAFTATANAKLWIDNDLKLTLSNSAPNYSGKYLRLWVYSGEATISYVLVRTHSATPPAATTFSGEQETAAPPATTYSATPLAGLAPLTVQFTDTSTGDPTSWAWNFGDGNTATAQNPQHTYTAPGTYSVNLTATNEYGSDYELKTDYITVYAPIVAQFTTNITGGTAPVAVQFTDTSTGDPTSWSWNFGDGNTSTAQNPQHTYTTAGTHTVTLNASHPYDTDTETKTAHITIAVLRPFPSLTALPRDLTGNGLYTDINGNNRLDYNDLTVFFQHLAWAKTAQPIACFDFNGNGWLDYNDVITLFTTITGEHP